MLNKVFLGGGGGGGQEDNNQGTPGTSGGGIVILRANSIIGNGYAVNADAFDALPGTCDAAGGGGAGGSVLLDVPSFTGTLNINVKGGNGAVTTCYTEGASGGGGGDVYGAEQFYRLTWLSMLIMALEEFTERAPRTACREIR